MDIRAKQFFFRFRYLLILLGLMLALTLATPRFFALNNFLNILWSVSVVGIMSMGTTFVLLVGKIDLSVGSIAALTGIFATSMIKAGRPIAFAIILAFLVGIIAGLFNGVMVSCLKVPEFITTLASGSILTGISQIVSNGKTISVLEARDFVFLGSGRLAGIPMPVFDFAIAFVCAFFILNFTVYGRKCYSVGGNPRAAAVSNISVRKVIILAYILSGITASFGGIVLSALNQQANATTADGYELDVIASIVIGGARMSGGVGTIQGTVFGTILLGLISNGLNLLSVPGTWHAVVKGAIIIIAITFNNFSVKVMQSSKAKAAL